MAYTPTEWKTGDVITADKLNHMEDGIASGGVLFVNVTPTSQTEGTTDKSYNEILAAIRNGQIPVVYYETNGTIVLYLKFDYLTQSDIYFGYVDANAYSNSIDYTRASISNDSPNTVYFFNGNINVPSNAPS